MRGKSLFGITVLPLLLTAVSVAADDSIANKPAANAAKQDANPGGPVEMSGMSILGNDEAPKSLVIVPWKSSQLGDVPGLSRLLDDATQPVDKDVFLRELSYYQIRSNSK
jgi:hypothetical protein